MQDMLLSSNPGYPVSQLFHSFLQHFIRNLRAQETAAVLLRRFAQQTTPPSRFSAFLQKNRGCSRWNSPSDRCKSYFFFQSTKSRTP